MGEITHNKDTGLFEYNGINSKVSVLNKAISSGASEDEMISGIRVKPDSILLMGKVSDSLVCHALIGAKSTSNALYLDLLFKMAEKGMVDDDRWDAILHDWANSYLLRDAIKENRDLLKLIPESIRRSEKGVLWLIRNGLVSPLQEIPDEQKMEYVASNTLGIFMLDDPSDELWIAALKSHPIVGAYAPESVIQKIMSSSGDDSKPALWQAYRHPPQFSEQNNGFYENLVVKSPYAADIFHGLPEDSWKRIIGREPTAFFYIRDKTASLASCFAKSMVDNKGSLSRKNMANMLVHTVFQASENEDDKREIRDICSGNFRINLNKESVAGQLKKKGISAVSMDDREDLDIQMAIVKGVDYGFVALENPHYEVVVQSIKEHPELVVFVEDPTEEIKDIVKEAFPDDFDKILNKKKHHLKSPMSKVERHWSLPEIKYSKLENQ